MTPGQIANGIAAGATFISATVFVLSYALMAKWWRSTEGRVMMLAGSGISGICLLTCILILLRFTTTPADWIRFVQAGLVATVAILFTTLTVQLWRSQLGRLRRRK